MEDFKLVQYKNKNKTKNKIQPTVYSTDKIGLNTDENVPIRYVVKLK